MRTLKYTRCYLSFAQGRLQIVTLIKRNLPARITRIKRANKKESQHKLYNVRAQIYTSPVRKRRSAIEVYRRARARGARSKGESTCRGSRNRSRTCRFQWTLILMIDIRQSCARASIFTSLRLPLFFCLSFGETARDSAYVQRSQIATWHVKCSSDPRGVYDVRSMRQFFESRHSRLALFTFAVIRWQRLLCKWQITS